MKKLLNSGSYLFISESFGFQGNSQILFFSIEVLYPAREIEPEKLAFKLFQFFTAFYSYFIVRDCYRYSVVQHAHGAQANSKGMSLPPTGQQQNINLQQLLQQLLQAAAANQTTQPSQPQTHEQRVLAQCKQFKLTIGGDSVTSYLDHEDFLARATPSELRKIFSLAAEAKILGIPVHQHNDPFLQSLGELYPLRYNPLQRFTPKVSTELLTPFFDHGYQSIAGLVNGRTQVAKLKEYRYLYSANSFLFEAASHLLSIAASAQVQQPVTAGLIAVSALLWQVYELLEKRRQALPLLNQDSAEFIDIALEGTNTTGPKPNIPELNAVFDKLQDLSLKRAKEKIKNSRGAGSTVRGRGRVNYNNNNNYNRGRGRNPSSVKGKEPAIE